MRSAARVLILAVVLAATAAATAAQPPRVHRALVDSDPVSDAVARAAEFWHGVPCAGVVAVISSPGAEAPPAGTNAPSPGGNLAAMWATWLAPSGANSFISPDATFSACVVHLNASVWPSWYVDDRDFAAFCKEMLHEYGHLFGHPDAGAAPDTIEYERPDLAHVALCERYRLIYGHRVFVSPRVSPPRTRGRRRGARR